MKDVFTAIYSALVNDSEVIERVDTGSIRRGWQNPVDVPSIRFFAGGSKSRGDDLNRTELIEEIFTVSVIADGDLEIEDIAETVYRAINRDSLQDSNIVFQSCFYNGNGRGTFFDTLRKKHRQDLSFTVIYSPV